MDIPDKELIAEFVVESQEGLADVERQMLALEAAGDELDIEQVNAVFRTMHSIKGAAGFLGLEQIGTLAHRLEELLNYMRNRELTSTPALITTMLRGADCIKEMLDVVEYSNETDISTHLSELAAFVPGATASATTEPEAPAVDEVPIGNPAATLSEAAREFVIECFENLEQMDRDLMALEQDPSATQLLRSIFRTMHTIKGGAGFLGLTSLEQLAHAAENLLGLLRDGSLVINAEITSALLEAIDQCRVGLDVIEQRGDTQQFNTAPVIQRLNAAAGSGLAIDSKASQIGLKQTGPALPGGAQPRGDTPAIAAQPALAPVLPPITAHREVVLPSVLENTPSGSVEGSTEKSVSSLVDTTIRVDVALLDKLMTRVGELVLARNQILQHISRLNSSELQGTAQRLNLITSELQEGVMKTRMQPIGNVWTKFPRVVRDLSGQLGKQVRIELEGADTELDKTIIEAIKDPLTHLVRNSIDHGIEAPAVRIGAGKNPEGRLHLRAFHEGGQVNIEISDDGAGLNLDRIRKKGVERGLIAVEQAGRMSDREVSMLIFAAGFSTAEQVTSVSGRGVGMDVVKTNIERIGGVIDLQSQPGLGTTIRIKIPLTLAIIPALIVTSEEDRYAIPQVNLLELVRLEGEASERGIEFLHGAPVYRLRGKLLPLVCLSESLKLVPDAVERLQTRTADAPINIVVLRADDRQLGLIVDKVCDTEEIVVKPLSKQLKRIGEYAGATIMGDGSVALILDVKGLSLAAGLGGDLQTVGAGEASDAQRQGQPMESVLVVDVGDARRFALPLSLVSRLEKISAAEVEHSQGQEVLQYRGRILPLVHLADVVGGATVAPADELQIVVYDRDACSFGLVVSRIVDTCETKSAFQAGQSSGPVLGTLVIQQRVTDVIDLARLAQSVSGQSLATLA